MCGVLFGLAPALQATRPALMPTLEGPIGRRVAARGCVRGPRPSLTQGLVVAQIAISLLLLVAAGLFVRTLSNLQSISLGFNREHVLLFELDAPQAGYPEARVADFYADLRRRLSGRAGRARRDAVACLAHQGRPRAPDHGRRRAGGADTASCGPGPGSSRPCRSRCCAAGRSGTRSPGNAARRRRERALRPEQFRRCRSDRTPYRDRRQHRESTASRSPSRSSASPRASDTAGSKATFRLSSTCRTPSFRRRNCER